jgi:hypothetical protein
VRWLPVAGTTLEIPLGNLRDEFEEIVQREYVRLGGTPQW